MFQRASHAVYRFNPFGRFTSPAYRGSEAQCLAFLAAGRLVLEPRQFGRVVAEVSPTTLWNGSTD